MKTKTFNTNPNPNKIKDIVNHTKTKFPTTYKLLGK